VLGIDAEQCSRTVKQNKQKAEGAFLGIVCAWLWHIEPSPVTTATDAAATAR
jgi:hypothetical protein